MNAKVLPVVKWIGGKRSLIPFLIDKLPTFTQYYEPFVGGGAMFFHLLPEYATLSDRNTQLIEMYMAIRDNLERVIEQLKVHKEKNCSEYYYKQRKLMPHEQDIVQVAARFIYLNKTCYNGLYRVNKKGEYNAAFGSYVNPPILDEDNLRAVSEALQLVTLVNRSFEDTPIEQNAFYYLDPPYHKTFTRYDKNGFSEEMQAKVAQFCREVDAKGGYFMVSNSDTPLIRKLFSGFDNAPVMAMRKVSTKASSRGKEQELRIRNY